MASYNKVILMGNMTRDPQMSYLPSQTPVVEVGLAVNRKWRAQDGQMREEVCFVDCRAYGKTAETINQYCKKGSCILIEGRLQFDQWEGKDGQKRSKHRVFIERFQFAGSPQGGGGQRPAGGNYAPRPAAAPAAAAAEHAPPAEDFPEPMPPEVEEQGGETIPF
jgi:single-strand DNA-binding protein